MSELNRTVPKMSEVMNNLLSWDPLYNIPLHGHTGPVWSVQATSDNRIIFSGSEDTTIIVWDAQTQQSIGVLKGHEKTVNALEVTCDDKILISGAWDNAIKLWDWESFEQVGELVGHTNGVYFFVLNKDSTLLVSGSGDGTAKIWNIQQRSLVASLDCVGNSVFCIALTSDEKILVTGGWAGMMKVWDFSTYALLSTLNGNAGVIQSMAITPDSKYLVFGTRNNVVKVWNFDTKTEYFTFNAHNNWVRNIVTTKDSMYFISASADKSIRMVNILEKTEEFNFEGNDGYVFGLCLSKDGTILYSGASDKIVRVRNIGAAQKISKLTGHTKCIMCIAISADNNHIVSSSEDKTIRKWDIATGTEVFVLNGHSETVWGVTITLDLRYIVSASGDLKVIIWDYHSAEKVCEMKSHINPIFCISTSNNCKLIASGAQDKLVKLWDLNKQCLLHTFEGHTDTVFTVKFMEDNQKLVSGAADYTIRVWCLVQKIQITKVNSKSGMIESISITKDGKYLGIGDRNNSVYLWDWEQVACLKHFKGHKLWVKCVAFSSDDKYLASCSNDRSIRIWNVKNQIEEMVLLGHTSTIRSVAYSNNGKYLASGSEDLTVRVWDLENKIIMKIADFSNMYDTFLLQAAIINCTFPNRAFASYNYSPLRVNLLHIYCYLDQSKLLALALAKIPLKLDLEGNSPLHYALERHSQSCVDLILEYCINLAKSTPVEFSQKIMFFCNDFILLMKNHSVFLQPFLECVFLTVSNSSVPRFGIPLRTLPIYKNSEVEKISHECFVKPRTVEKPEIELEITFKYLPFALNLEIGSKNSIELLSNLIKNEQKHLFGIDLIHALIDYKWKSLWNYFFFNSFLHWLGLFFLILYMQGVKDSYIVNISLGGILAIIHFYQIFFAKIMSEEGLSNVLNLFASFGLILMTAANELAYPVMILNLFAGILALNIFEQCRVYVRIFFAALKDVFLVGFITIPVMFCINIAEDYWNKGNFFAVALVNNKEYFYVILIISFAIAVFFNLFLYKFINIGGNSEKKSEKIVENNRWKLTMVLIAEKMKNYGKDKPKKQCFFQMCQQMNFRKTIYDTDENIKNLIKNLSNFSSENNKKIEEIQCKLTTVEENIKKLVPPST